MSDISSLCAAMPFMVGCTFLKECQPLLTSVNKRHVETDFEFLGNHAASMMH